MATLHDLVEENITKHSANIAVVYDDGSVKSCVTYQELGNRSDCIRGVLRSLGVDNETVGLCMPQNADLPSVILGILKTPASFYPFDGDGLDFIRYSLGRLCVRYILVHIDLLQKVDELTYTLHGVVVPCMELLDFGLVLVSLPKVVLPPQQSSLAYCITTSGTTSTPKVVRVPHTCIVPNITHLRNIFQIRKDDVCFLASPLTFDPSIVEMFVTLTSGATLLITSNEVKSSPEKLLHALHHRNKVSVLQMTPTLLMRFRAADLKTTLLGSGSRLRILTLGGEKFPSVDMLRTLLSPDCQTRFLNLYGITEVSTWATCYKLDADYIKCGADEVPLGSVLDGTKVKVISSEGHEISKGEGQLLIGSETRVCLLNDETEEDIKDQVIWRNSGDIVHITTDGTITYAGRLDDQIKRHGKRLSMAAIEHAAQQLSSVEDSRVVFSEQRLLLFLVAKEPSSNVQHAAFKMEVKSHLQKTFPAHYQPDDVILTDAIPVTKHGKTDRKALVSWWKAAISGQHIGPEDVPQWCQSIWMENLNSPLESIKEMDMFLSLGGDSLRAVNVVNCVETVTGVISDALLDTLLNRTFQDFVRDVQKLCIHGQTASNIRNSAEGVKEVDDLTADLSDSSYWGSDEEKSMPKRDSMELRSVSDHEKHLAVSDDQSEVEEKQNVHSPKGTCTEEDPTLAVSLTVTNDFVGSVSRGSTYKGRISDVMIPGDMDEDSLEELSLEQCWKYDTGKCVDASPLIALSSSGSHVVYVGSHSHAMCSVDLTTGSEVWRTQLGDRIESSACLSQCGRWVVVGCYDNSVYVLCSTRGRIKWKYETDDCVKSSPSLDPLTSHIIIGSHDHCLYALDICMERCVWRCPLGSGSVFSSPCVSSYHRHTYVGTLGSRLCAVNTDTGGLIWSSQSEKPIFSSPAENDQCVVIGCVDGTIYCYTHHGHKMWTFPTGAPVFSSPTLLTLPPDKKEVILVGSHDKHMYCVSMTGEELWSWEADSTLYATSFLLRHRRQGTGTNHLSDMKPKLTPTDDIAIKPAITDNDISVNFKQASLEKKLHFQTELSNGVTFKSARSNPSEFIFVKSNSDSCCHHVIRYSKCAACTPLDGRSYLDGEPCTKKFKYDLRTVTDIESKMEEKEPATLRERISSQSSLCLLCGKSKLFCNLPDLNGVISAMAMPSNLRQQYCQTSGNVPSKEFLKERCQDSIHESSRTSCVMCECGSSASQNDSITEKKILSTKSDLIQSTEHHRSNDFCQCNEMCSIDITQSEPVLSLEKQSATVSCNSRKSSSNSTSQSCASQSPLVCVASTTGTLSVLDGTTGRPVASVGLPGEVFSSPVAVGGHVVVGCRDNYLYCYKLTSSTSRHVTKASSS